jgi:hypothetical protein
MDKDRDLLPWIFGGLSMAAAIALTVGSGNVTASRNSPAPSVPTALLPTAHILPAADVMAAPAPALAPAPAPEQISAAAQIQTATARVEPGSQIWECTTNGQKTFSDKPCGDKPSLHELGPINGMDPTPILPRARPYAAEPSREPDYYPGAQDDSGSREQQFAANSYPAFIGIPIREHRRGDHERRPDSYHHRLPPRRN